MGNGNPATDRRGSEQLASREEPEQGGLSARVQREQRPDCGDCSVAGGGREVELDGIGCDEGAWKHAEG
jgi:hypothetical protein